MIAIEWKFVGDAAELGIRRNEDGENVSLEAAYAPGTKELNTTKADSAGDAKCTDVRQSLMPIVVRSVDTERELTGWKRLGGRHEPEPGVAEVSR